MSQVIEILRNEGTLSEYLSNYEQRDQQVELSLAIEEAINNGDTLLAQAPTGVGKSLAYLIPAILSGQKFVVATATKNLQHQLLDKDVPTLKNVFSKLNKEFDAVLFKGRGNYLSKRRLRDYMDDPTRPPEVTKYDPMIEGWLGGTHKGDFEELTYNLPREYKSNVKSDTDDCQGRGCPFFGECFYYSAKRRAQKADVLIVNHDLLAVDTVMKNTGAPGILPAYDGIILDEAHNFEDTIGKYLGFKMNKFVFSNLTGIVNRTVKEEKEYFKENKEDKDYIKQLTTQMFQQASEFFGGFVPPKVDNGRLRLKPHSITSYIESKYSTLVNTLQLIDEFLSMLPGDTEEGADSADVAKTRIVHIKQRLKMLIELKSYYKSFVFWVDIDKNVTVNSAPIDAAPYLKEWLFDREPLDKIREKEKMYKTRYVKSVIMTSATLATDNSFDYIKQRLGISEAKELISSDVFNYPEQSLIYIPPNAVEANASNFSEVAAGNIIQILQLSKGRAFVLFTSYAEMNRVLDMVRPYIPYTILVQGKGPRGQLIQQFKNDKHSVLFGTSSFWEGVDISGDALGCVIIDKIPFPQVGDPLIEARVDSLKDSGQDWFNDYYVPNGIISLVQGFGRLIRSRRDSGVVAFMDNRLMTKNYGYKFLRSLPKAYRTHDVNMVAQFYAYHSMINQNN